MSERSASGVLFPFIGSYARSIEAAGYTRLATQYQAQKLRRLSRWMDARKIGLGNFNEGVIENFVADCLRGGHPPNGEAAISLRLLSQLRELGLVAAAEPLRDESPVGEVQRRFEVHLTVERGLTERTVKNYWPSVRGLLVERFSDGPVRFGEVTVQDISAFVLRRARSMSPRRAQVMTTALRSFFRFLLQAGEITKDLASSVPRVAAWRLSNTPKYIGPEEVERVLNTCDPTTTIGRRDYAILLLLARLGLRAGEVVALELGDIDWRAGEILVRGKMSVQDRLPLTQDVGEALASYLRGDRPSWPGRHVFMRSLAPRRRCTSAAVGSVVRRALERAGVPSPARGSHLLRHSLATTLLRGGASLAEVGDVLRHRRIQTTEIYAKVDLKGLRSIARPWPVGVAP
jgi:integrase/recombinase XerD